MAFPDTELDISILAYLGADPTEDSSAWPTPVDLSARLMRDTITVTQGRRPGQDTLSSGSCTFELINTAIGDGIGANAAGVLTPDNPLSPYYAIWDLGAPVAIDVDGVGASPPYGLYRGYIAALEPRIVPGFGEDWSTVKVTLGGVMRRLGRGSVERSCLQYAILSVPPMAYWSLGDGPDSQWGSLTLGQGGNFTATDWGTNALPGESEVASWLGSGLTLVESSVVSAPFALLGGLSRLVFDFTFNWDYPEAGTTQFFSVAMQRGGEFSPTETGCEVLVTRTGGGTFTLGANVAVNLATSGAGGAISAITPGPHHVRMDMQQSGADISIDVYLDGTAVSGTATKSATALSSLAPARIRMLHSSTESGAEVTFTDLAVWVDTAPPSLFDCATAATTGYAGEQAHVRLGRVCTQQNIPFATAAIESITCGPQPIADVPTILRDTEKVDRGILIELTSDWGLGYVSSAERANRIATMVIDLSAYRTGKGTAAGVFTPIRDDSRLRNEWTINRPDGGYGTAKDEANQKKRGRYDDSDEVNVETDDMLANQASWRLREDSYDGWRYRTMPIDLAANASAALIDLLAAWLGTSIGDRIDRVSPPSGYAEEHLQLLGYTQRIGRKSWWVDLVVELETPWEVNVYTEDDPLDDQPTAIPGRWAEDPNCAIRSALTTSTTSIPFDPNTFRWTTSAVTPDDFPFNARLVSSPAAPTSGGELVTVTALSTTAATYVAVGTAAHASNAAVSPGNYSGGAANDWVMVVARARNSTATLTISDSNYTYTELAHQGGLYVWAAVRTSTAPAPTITPSGGAANMTVSAQVFGLGNMPITRPLTEYLLVSPALLGQTNASTQNIAYAGTEAGHIPGRVVLLIAGKSDDWTSAAQSVFTEVSEATTTTGDDQSLYIGYLIQTTPTLVSPGSITVTGGSSAVSDSVLLVLAGGFQTATVTRKTNGIEKSHDAGTGLQVENALIWAL